MNAETKLVLALLAVLSVSLGVVAWGLGLFHKAQPTWALFGLITAAVSVRMIGIIWGRQP